MLFLLIFFASISLSLSFPRYTPSHQIQIQTAILPKLPLSHSLYITHHSILVFQLLLSLVQPSSSQEIQSPQNFSLFYFLVEN